MTTIYFVRHGEAEAGFGSHRDPGLSELGRTQAVATAKHLASVRTQFLSLAVRCFELRKPHKNSPKSGMHQSPSKIALQKSLHRSKTSPIVRRGWRTLWQVNGTICRLILKVWREALIDCVVSAPTDCVMFSHFVAINLLVGAANDHAAMVSFRPDNASISRFESDGSTLTVLGLGEQAQTRMLIKEDYFATIQSISCRRAHRL